MTNPTPLSLAAQAVWDAYNQFDHSGMHVRYRIKLAAALRAAAEELNHPTSAHTLYAIADELEAQ